MTPEVDMNEKVVLTGLGGPETVGMVNGPLPLPEAGEVRVRVEAAGAAYGDIIARRGMAMPKPRFPFVPGYDLVGVVDALGAGARIDIGSRVAALPGAGGQQRYVCLAEEELVPVPQGVTSERAAAVVLNYLTAYQLLVRAARLEAGGKAFVYGLAGGLGSALRDIGRVLGIEIAGTASGRRIDALNREGVRAFDRHDPELATTVRTAIPDGFDAVLDPLGGASLNRSYRLIGKTGTLVMLGAATAVQGGDNVPLALVATMARLGLLKLRPDTRRVMIYAVPIFKAKHPALFREDLALLLGWLRDGKINPQIAEVALFSDASRVHEMLEAGSVQGKIVLQPSTLPT